jgi:hypothetical protein
MESFRFPSRTELADALGMSSVHVNRILQIYRAQRFWTFNGTTFTSPITRRLSVPAVSILLFALHEK